MPLVHEETFGDRPIARIFFAARVREARRAEEALDARGIEYFVRLETWGRTLFGSPRTGAAFYVDPDRADECEAALMTAGLEIGIVRDPPGSTSA